MCERALQRKRWRGGIKPWLRAILVSTRGILAQSGTRRALILQGTQLITVSTSLWGSKYTGINTKSSETSIYCITATKIFMQSALCRATWILQQSPLKSTEGCIMFQHYYMRYNVALISN